MKAWQRAAHHHHHQRINALLIQYDHLNAEQREIAAFGDILAIVGTLTGSAAVRVIEKVAAQLRVHR